jgi:hypothetical protein
MMRRALVIGTMVGLASVAGAQTQKPTIPSDMVPPPGMCRVWIRGVPAKQQPAQTDCKTAIKSKPPNADVVYGDDYVKKATPTEAKGNVSVTGTPPAARGAAAVQTKPPTVPPKRGGGGGG